jgi:hypothetical protein
LAAVLGLPGSAFAGGSVYVNEIGYAANAAATNGTQFEYIELFNPFSVPTDVTGWTLEDSTGTLYVFGSLAVPAHAFVVVYSNAAAGTIAVDADISDGSATLVAGADWPAGDLVNTGDAVQLYDPFGIIDYVYFDEANVGDATIDDAAVNAGIWKDGAAIDTVAGTTVGRSIALKVDGAAPNQDNAGADAEDLDWMQYALSPGGTPGWWNDPTTIFKDAFETGLLSYWSNF